MSHCWVSSEKRVQARLIQCRLEISHVSQGLYIQTSFVIHCWVLQLIKISSFCYVLQLRKQTALCIRRYLLFQEYLENFETHLYYQQLIKRPVTGSGFPVRTKFRPQSATIVSQYSSGLGILQGYQLKIYFDVQVSLRLFSSLLAGCIATKHSQIYVIACHG